MEITWGSLLTLAGTTGLISAAFTQGLTWVREWRTASTKSKANASYLALRLAVILEGYAYSCSEFISDNGAAPHLPDNEFPEWDTSLPELPHYPDDADGWRAMDRNLAGRVLGFPNKVRSSRGIIRLTIEHTPEDLGETLDEQAAERGLEAWQLAEELRRTYNIPAADVVWSYAENLQAALDAAKKAQAERDERHAKFLEELAADDTRAGVPNATP